MPPTLRTTLAAACIVAAALLAACSVQPISGPATEALEAVFTIQADQGAIVRAITRASACPRIEWDGAQPLQMAVRAAPAVVPVRAGANSQLDSKDAAFPVLTCEAAWPSGARSARVEGRPVAAPAQRIARVLILGDTGCRLKASDNAFQPCNDAGGWPFARIVSRAAAMRPDLVMHVGDYHYRESPCPAGNASCANSAWGYGWDTWAVDFFEPAKALLAAAPWVVVRGNHESCFRAGQGWFRFMDPQPWSQTRTCDVPANDAEADYSQPYAVPLGGGAQFIVFDSSAAAGRPLAAGDPALAKYVAQMERVAALAGQAKSSIFLAHHPVLGFAPSASGRPSPGNAALQSAMKVLQPQRLFPPGVELAIHGHIHLFESISFAGDYPATLVTGNSGSAADIGLPAVLPAGAQPWPGAVVEEFTTLHRFGFATLDRVEASDVRWLLTEYDADGVPVLRCDIAQGKSRCRRA